MLNTGCRMRTENKPPTIENLQGSLNRRAFFFAKYIDKQTRKLYNAQTLKKGDEMETLTEYVLRGDTFQHRERLKQMGLTWDAEKKAWTTYDQEAHALAELLVTTKGGALPAPGNFKDFAKKLDAIGDIPTSKPANDEKGQAKDLSFRELVSALRTLGEGRVGTDYARTSIEELRAFGYDKHGTKLDEEAKRIIEDRGPKPDAKPEEATTTDEEETVKTRKPRQAKPKEQPMPQSQAEPTDETRGLAEQLAKLLTAPKNSALDEPRVREIVAEEAPKALGSAIGEAIEAAMASAAPQRIEISVNALPAVEATGCHPLMPKVLALANAGVNVLMVGPAGAGKTHLAHDCAKALGRSFGSISLSAGVTESHLTGRLLPIGENGRFGYIPSPFVRAYAEGGVYLFDELDAADPNVLLAVNAALANDGFDVEARAASGLETRVQRHAETIMLAAANTYGTGADTSYAGRNVLDAATLDRWYIVAVDYHREYEAMLGGVKPEETLKTWQPMKRDEKSTKNEQAVLTKWVWAVRKAAQEKKYRRVVSTRMIEKAVRAISAGVSFDEIKKDLLNGWTYDEKRGLGSLAEGIA
jgi:MoxR-like ATPase